MSRNRPEVMPSTSPVPAAFDSFSTGAANSLQQAGVVSHIAREESELKGQIIAARSMRRDESACFARLYRSCERPAFASDAAYSFPRGGQKITGPSVRLAREAARCWGNLRYGLRIVSTDENWIHVKGVALDLETNLMIEAEDRFRCLIQRTGKGWVVPDERDLRELINRRGAICVRNALLEVLPPDLIDEAMELCAQTMIKAATGEIKQQQTPEQSRRHLVYAFTNLGVTDEMLKKFLKHNIDSTSPEEIVELRKIYRSLLDGMSRREDHFDVTDVEASSDPQTGPATPETNEVKQVIFDEIVQDKVLAGNIIAYFESLPNGQKKTRSKLNIYVSELLSNGQTIEQIVALFKKQMESAKRQTASAPKPGAPTPATDEQPVEDENTGSEVRDPIIERAEIAFDSIDSPTLAIIHESLMSEERGMLRCQSVEEANGLILQTITDELRRAQRDNNEARSLNQVFQLEEPKAKRSGRLPKY